MKHFKHLLTLAIIVIALSAQAQWNTLGSNIYNSNTGNVGVGTSTPASKLSVSGSESSSNGKAAAIEISNTAPKGRNWYIRAGASGTTTPPGGLTIADDAFYRLVIDSSGRVGIGTSTTLNSSAILDINSTSRGVLVPRMTKSQRDLITTPATGLLIYQTNNSPGFYYYDGSSWSAVTPKSANKTLSNLNATTAVNVDLLPATTNTLNLGSSSLSWNNIYGVNSTFRSGVSVDFGDQNSGAPGNWLSFGGSGTGEGIGSRRTGGDNQYGLDFYTGAVPRMSISLGGNVGISTTTPLQKLDVNGSINLSRGSALYVDNKRVLFIDDQDGFGFYNRNIFLGTDVGRVNAANEDLGEGLWNCGFGYQAFYSNTTGTANSVYGNWSLFSNSAGSDNTAIGFSALSDVLTNNNTGLGSSAGDNHTETNSTFVGAFAYNNANGYSNNTVIGYNASGTASNQVRIGNSSVTSIGGFAGWTTLPSDGRFKKNIKDNVPGLEFISKLNPITYTLDVDGIEKVLHPVPLGHDGPAEVSEETKRLDETAREEKSKIVYSGFIAQDVEKAAKEIDYDFSGVDAPKNDGDVYGLRYAEFVVPLVKAVQELSSQDEGFKTEDARQKSKTDSLQFALFSLQKENVEMKNQIAELQSSIVNQQSSMTDGFAELKTLNSKPETILGQNMPNPFDNSTLIPFRIPKDCKDASIMITNTSTSEVISVIPISCNEDHVSIDAGMLASWTYSYTLYVDGKMIDTKSMIITK